MAAATAIEHRPLAYYGDRIRPHMTRTPEGYLVCHSVPIARTGNQDYIGREIGLTDKPNERVTVFRDPAEVFKPAAVASFEGKPVVDGHPGDAVRPDNYAGLARGHVQNVRQGTGADMDLLLADLFVTDPNLINDIDNGKRDVSCGYDCRYEPMADGRYHQVDIRGNHVAVVPKGRAGDRVSIKDEAPITTTQEGPDKPQTTRRERRPRMKSDRQTIWGRMLSAFAKDADPEELAEAARMAPKEDEARDALGAPAVMPPKPSPVAPAARDDEEAGESEEVALLRALVGEVKRLSDRLDALEAGEAGEDQPEGLDALIGELQGSTGVPQESPAANGEESVTVPPEEIHDADADVELTEAEKGVNPLTGDALLPYLKRTSAVLASTVTDDATRRRVSDALAREFRAARAPSIAAEDGYAALLAARGMTRKTEDSKGPDPTELGKKWAKKFNPNYKEGQ